MTGTAALIVGNQDFVLKLGDPSAILRCWHGRGGYHHNLLWSFHQTKCVINELDRTERNGVGGRPTDPPVSTSTMIWAGSVRYPRYIRALFANMICCILSSYRRDTQTLRARAVLSMSRFSLCCQSTQSQYYDLNWIRLREHELTWVLKASL